jgi:hypothetical protein
MLAAWLCLIGAIPLWSTSRTAVDLEEPDNRSYAEATPAMLARRARACRADLADYRLKPDPDLMDRLIICMEHPDADLRAAVLDDLPKRSLWDRPDYESRIRPSLQEVFQRFQKDPDERVQLHASQLDSSIRNAEIWRNYDSPAAQARRRAETENPHTRIDGDSAKLGDYVLIATVIAMIVVMLAGGAGALPKARSYRPGRR